MASGFDFTGTWQQTQAQQAQPDPSVYDIPLDFDSFMPNFTSDDAALNNLLTVDPLTFALNPAAFGSYSFDPALLLQGTPVQQQQHTVNNLQTPEIDNTARGGSSKSKKTAGTRSAYASSCSACRFRKVRCVRTDIPGDPCVSCAKKAINCVSVPNDGVLNTTKRQYKDRSGQRIEKAKAILGEASASSEELKSSDASSSHSGSPSTSVILSPSSVASQMDQVQISAAFCSTLVEGEF